MAVRLLDWSCSISCLVFGFSKGPLLELGEIVGLRVGLGQSALVELGELRLITVVPGVPTIKSFLNLNMFLVA